MKKIILIAGLLLCGLTQAQTVTVTGNGETIANNDTVTFNQLSTAEDSSLGNLDLVVTNTSTENITMRMKAVAITNNDTPNNNLQFCVQPQCFNIISEGTTIPTNLPDGGILLAPGASTEGDNHFRNSYAGDDDSMPVSYVIAVITVDGDGNETGELMRFTYVYDSTAASVTDFESLKNAGITLNSTIIKDNMQVDALQNATVAFYNTSGQLIKNAAITSGTQLIDLSSLATAVYIARFTTEDNKTSQIRVVKQ
ncbi:T9SS type A sorting domain-containing protein [Flavobacterium litorale]|uniref:T9SS type A sorting domain-containing protein n=1 Tax=Flavobacterium litorale TaxID=2856519 RepID=A0ABX8VE19_9FLAO|nr:T9SS type A sorting domain-containing protein [Flavobacterium litorale]QYJ69276.1 T9SS type A sorting domain-containing protein [Flavobacterium litorale]